MLDKHSVTIVTKLQNDARLPHYYMVKFIVFCYGYGLSYVVSKSFDTWQSTLKEMKVFQSYTDLSLLHIDAQTKKICFYHARQLI